MKYLKQNNVLIDFVIRLKSRPKPYAKDIELTSNEVHVLTSCTKLENHYSVKCCTLTKEFKLLK